MFLYGIVKKRGYRVEMDDDTIYIPRNDNERKILKEKGIRAFRRYRLDLYEIEKKIAKEDKV